MQQQEGRQPAPGECGYPCGMFLTAPDLDLTCGICMEVLNDPVLVCGEQHTYCRACIALWKDTKSTCPECRVPISQGKTNRLAKNMIDKLEVRCPHAGCDGCDGGGDGSGQTNSASSSSDIPADAEDGHQHKKSRQENSAEPSSAAATYCAWTGQVKDYEAHVAACPFMEVSCPFEEAGCTFRAARRDMGAHSGDTAAHLLMLMTTVAAGKAKIAVVEAESAAVKVESAAVKAENAAMKGTIASLEVDSRRLQLCVSILHASVDEEAAGDMEWVSSRSYPAADGNAGSTYTGQMRGGRCHGFGRASWAAGRYQTYDGQWKEGKKSGHALMNYRSGDTYEGDFGEDGRHGRGVSRYSTGERYEGQWKEDKIHGQGVYTNNIGDGYNGEWKENKFHGQGVYTWSSGISYEGAWRDSKRHGQGVHRFRNGDSEVGRWVKDRQQGCFILTKADGTRYDRTYESDRRVSETPIPHTTPNPERGTMTVRFA
mmetsp:Transcript_27538/g.62443  ORF Transcript_27538/g.62443 Transcript_27538/m.62443 type:complete len:485 (+) Transcript_27538:41-1495(+)